MLVSAQFSTSQTSGQEKAVAHALNLRWLASAIGELTLSVCIGVKRH